MACRDGFSEKISSGPGARLYKTEDLARYRADGAVEFLENLLAYERQQLSGARFVLELPTDHPRPAFQSFRGARCDFALPKSLADK
jgi:hypothetical protein